MGQETITEAPGNDSGADANANRKGAFGLIQKSYKKFLWISLPLHYKIIMDPRRSQKNSPKILSCDKDEVMKSEPFLETRSIPSTANLEIA
tara:strand:+ start:546 stop:818 length:273 start_codon:yes stop_codon:yes gene_type:complete